MKQIPDTGDSRLRGMCAFCGRQPSTRDHIPPKVFLDKPLPDNVAVVPSCLRCNRSSSVDEQYLACLIDCVLAGNVELAKAQSNRVANAIDRSPKFETLLRKAHRSEDGVDIHDFDAERVNRVLVKLARGHVAFEINELWLWPPHRVSYAPLHQISDPALTIFEDGSSTSSSNEPEVISGWPEVGSRAMFRIVEGQDILPGGWINVQQNRYRYRVSDNVVSIVIAEYLAVEVEWQSEDTELETNDGQEHRA
ncbi:MAG: hypothetical protein AAGI54_13495 [Planctomycetota bacterium]